MRLEAKQTTRQLHVKATLAVSALIIGLVVASVLQTGIRKQSLADQWSGEYSISGNAQGAEGMVIYLVHDRNNNGIYDIGDEVVHQTTTNDSGNFKMVYQPPLQSEWKEVWNLKSIFDDVELQPNGDALPHSSDLDLNEEIVGICLHRDGSNRSGVIQRASLILTAAELEQGYCALTVHSGLHREPNARTTNTGLISINSWIAGQKDTLDVTSVLITENVLSQDSIWLWLYPGEGLDDRDAKAFEVGKESPTTLVLNCATQTDIPLLLVPDSKDLTPPVHSIHERNGTYHFYQKEVQWSLINCKAKRRNELIEFKWTTRIPPPLDAQVAVFEENGITLYEGMMKDLERSNGAYQLTVSDPASYQEFLNVELKLWDSSKVVLESFELLNDIEAVTDVKIGPNPLRDEAQLTCVTTQSLPVRIYDLTGNMIANFPSGVGRINKKIPTNSWRKGTYILKIGDDQYQTKLVKI